MYEEHTHQQSDGRPLALTPEEQWAWCEVVYEGVKKAKALEEEERLLELQLEEKRTHKKQAQTETIECLAQVLGVRRTERTTA